MSKNDKTFVFKSIKFRISDSGILSYRNRNNPDFKELFKLFNPQVQHIYFKKSDFSNRSYVIGKSDYFNTFYFLKGDQKTKLICL